MICSYFLTESDLSYYPDDNFYNLWKYQLIIGIVAKVHFLYKASLSELGSLYSVWNHQKTKSSLIILREIEVN